MRSWVLTAALALALAACATKEDGGSGQGGQATGTAGTSGGTAGTSGGTAGGDGFGNGSGSAAGVNGGAGSGNPDAGCAVGVFCPPPEPDPLGCGEITFEGDVETKEMPGNALMIFDRSGSMTSEWNGMPRWQAAGGAMTGALTPVQDLLTIGAVFFPSDQGLLSCLVDPISNATTQIAFQPGAMALAKMQTGGAGGIPMYQPGLGSTPTMPALRQADAAFNSATLSGTTVAILVTDGDPTCSGADAWDQAMAVNIVSAWLAKGIKTYVLGVPGVGGTGVATLNAVAAAGGTTQYIPPTDAAMFQKTIQDIVLQTVKVGFDSCTINLTPAADVPEKLRMVVKENGMEFEVPRMYMNGDAAWSVTSDGKTVEIVGDTCEAAKNGTYEAVRFEFGCKDLPPAEPPIVPE
jgi:hypothetical protein